MPPSCPLSLSLSLSLVAQPSRSIAASVLSLFPPPTGCEAARTAEGKLTSHGENKRFESRNPHLRKCRQARNLPSSGKSKKSEEGTIQQNKQSWKPCAREGSRRGHGERSPGAPRTDGARSGAGPPSRGRAGSGGVGLPPSHPRPLPGHRWTKQRRAEQPQGLQVWTTLGFSSAASRMPLH